MGKVFGNCSASPKGVKNSVRGTARSEMGHQHAKWGEKISANGTAKFEMGHWHKIKNFDEKRVWKLVHQP